MASFISVSLRIFDYLGCYLCSYLAPIFVFLGSFEFYILAYIKQSLTTNSYSFILSFIQYILCVSFALSTRDMPVKKTEIFTLMKLTMLIFVLTGNFMIFYLLYFLSYPE